MLLSGIDSSDEYKDRIACRTLADAPCRRGIPKRGGTHCGYLGSKGTQGDKVMRCPKQIHLSLVRKLASSCARKAQLLTLTWRGGRSQTRSNPPGPAVRACPYPPRSPGEFGPRCSWSGVEFKVVGSGISSGRVLTLNTRPQRKSLHAWMILVIVEQHLAQIGRMDGPTKCLS